MAAVTIQAVAREAGMSYSTTAHILRGRSHLYASKTREKVIRAARELGYCGNAAARATSTGVNNAYAMLMSKTVGESFLPTRLLTGLGSSLGRRNKRLVLRHLPEDADDDLLREQSLGLMEDGFFLNYICMTPAALGHLIEKNQLSNIYLNRRESVCAVHPDDRGDMCRATARLIAAGHRRILYLDNTQQAKRLAICHYSHADRRAGYEDAMRAAGLTPRFLREESCEVSRLPALYRTALEDGKRPTAAVCYAWEDGNAMLVAARAAGLEPTRAMAVAAVFADMEPRDPAMLRVMVDWERVAEESVRMMEALFEARREQHPLAPPPAVAVPALQLDESPPPGGF